jgi:hypothetical protein
MTKYKVFIKDLKRIKTLLKKICLNEVLSVTEERLQVLSEVNGAAKEYFKRAVKLLETIQSTHSASVYYQSVLVLS